MIKQQGREGVRMLQGAMQLFKPNVYVEPVKDLSVTHWLYIVGWVSVALFAVSYTYTDMLSNVAVGLMMLLALVLFCRDFKLLSRGQLVIYLFYAAIGIQVLSWSLNYFSGSELAESSPKLHRLGTWFYFLPIFLFIRSNSRLVFAIWLIAIAALLSSPWSKGDGWNEIKQGLDGSRVYFGINNAQHMGMMFGVALIGLVVFAWRMLDFFTGYKKILAGLFLLLFLLVFVAAVNMSQTRAIWLALLVTAVLWPVIYFMLYRIRKPEYRELDAGGNAFLKSPLLSMLLLCGIVLVGLITLNFINQRFVDDDITSMNALWEHPQAVGGESVNVRLYTWKEALTWIESRPLLGWGGKGRGAVVKATPELSPSIKARFNHLHNSYLDLTVNYGLIGLLFYLSLLFVISKQVLGVPRTGKMQISLQLFWLLFLVFWSIANLFESYMFYSSGEYVFNIVVAGCLALANYFQYQKNLIQCSPAHTIS